MLYLIILFAVWLLIKRIKAHCKAYPYLPETIPKEPETIDDPALDFANAEIDRLKTLKLEYMAVLDGIEQEQADLQAEYRQASVKRKSAISSKLTSLARQHASTTKTLQGIDTKIEKLYNKTF